MRVLFNVTFGKQGSEYSMDRGGDGVDAPGSNRDKSEASLRAKKMVFLANTKSPENTKGLTLAV
jgi:hypothetical protein